MADRIETAPTGRARCRGCRENIAKGELRFGEEVANSYAEEADATTMHWFHLRCAAERRAVELDPVLSASSDEIPERGELAAIVADGVRNPALSRVRKAERSPSGRARCRQCRELIAKAELRMVMEAAPEAEAMYPTYFVHVRCAVTHVGGEGLLAKLQRLSPDLGVEDLSELAELLGR